MFGGGDKVSDNMVVQYRYTLKNPSGQVLEQSPAEGSWYLHGQGELVEGLEKAMNKRKVGDKFQVVVPEDDAYGPRHDDPMQLALPRDRFPAGFPFQVGSSITLESPDGYMFTVYITSIDGDVAQLEDCHPYAGMDLHYDVEILSVRKADKDELAHGHVHGPGGAH